jgi:hypothetical protein
MARMPLFPIALALIVSLAALASLWVQHLQTGEAANLSVNDTSDNLVAGDGKCTLREAIVNANTDSDSTGGDCAAGNGADVINLPSGTYTLSIAGTSEDAAATGDLDIADDLTINGAGQATTIIDGNCLDRVFHISGSIVVNLSGVTVQHGDLFGFQFTGGGGILNHNGTLTITDSTINDNRISHAGGGIFNNSGVLTLSNSTISNNTSDVDGGGIFNHDGTLELVNTTVSGNRAVEGSGGIRNVSGTVALVNTTVNGNQAGDGPGGGIRNTSGMINLNNSTISGNTSDVAGGGISNRDGTVELVNSTVSGNRSLDSVDGSGGGISNRDGTVELLNTIVARNTATNSTDCDGTVDSMGHNLIGDVTDCNFVATTGDLVGAASSPIDPKLGDLQNNGGPTFTHALLSNSPAVDGGDNVPCPPTDQRGVSRPQGAACDIGAYEFAPPPGTVVEIDIEPGGVPTLSNATTGGRLYLSPFWPCYHSGSSVSDV